MAFYDKNPKGFKDQNMPNKTLQSDNPLDNTHKPDNSSSDMPKL